MIDQEMVDFLTRKRDEAKVKAEEAAAELARREATLQKYIGGTVTIETPKARDDNPDPIEVWGPLLKQGMSFTRDELRDLLESAGWSRDYSSRAFSMAITTNVGTGNMILRDDGKYHGTTDKERERALKKYHQKRGTKPKSSR